MAQGHMIPMMDLARLILAHHKNNNVTVVTTPRNAIRFASRFSRYTQEHGFRFRLVELEFPCIEAGLPDGCENIDMLPSLDDAMTFFLATRFLRRPVEKLFQELTPPPSCIIADMCLPYTIHIAKQFKIPRISFIGVSCFYLLCMHNINMFNAESEEYFVVPCIPDRIEITIPHSEISDSKEWKQFSKEVKEAEMESYGVMMNSFEELEAAYARGYKEVRNNNKAWCIGPVSLSNQDHLDKAQRGNKNSVYEWQHLKWLDLRKPKSVVYVCFGSICNLTSLQLIEIGLALEASNRPFIWVIREGTELEALEKWIQEDGFEGRIKGRGLLIRGWAPQLLILSHHAIGGFITHCGWNSTMEAICAAVPMATWPLFSDQFLNEKLIMQILGVGVKVGEKTGALVKKEKVEGAIETLMGDSSESETRRKRVSELAQMARKAVENGGSSHTNLASAIQDIMQEAKRSH
ncbi:UDP-glycosyltransferase [Stylosanthes scabra]|uniref:Glycosyltransferase n=1 Tax=Stylosanthes scabra TaxID=79078 RepID=A0ABU6URH9_9FABA|nr:UDP-glycosyltransferase [Stylosanthes scabra]